MSFFLYYIDTADSSLLYREFDGLAKNVMDYVPDLLKSVDLFIDL